jgi:hypothetical protein
MRVDLLSFATASAFFGATHYVNVVEQPARLALDARAMVREWTPRNRRGVDVRLARHGLRAFGLCRVHSQAVRWLLGGTIVLASWPYAYFVMIAVNSLLCGIRRMLWFR